MDMKHYITGASTTASIKTRLLLDSDLEESSDSDFELKVEEEPNDTIPGSLQISSFPETSSLSQHDLTSSEESSSDDDQPPRRKKYVRKVRDLVPKKPEFSEEHSGTKIYMGNNTSPYSFLKLFLNASILQLISRETNNYIKNNTNIILKSRIKQWKDLTPNELLLFIATCFAMTRIKKLILSEYWSKNPILETPIFSKLFPRDRFYLIMKMLHFHDNSIPRCDYLIKIDSVIEHFRQQFRNGFYPSKKFYIDESLLLFKGRLKIKQYNPSIRNGFEFKTFLICDYETNYIVDFTVYLGAGTDIRDDGFRVCGSTISALIEPFLDNGHTLYIDNWHSSPDLFMWLYNRAMDSCDTVQKTGAEMLLMEEKLKKGQMIFRTIKGKLITIQWCDKRDAWFLSTPHTLEVLETNNIDWQTKEKAKKPKLIVDCNKYMVSVDQCDVMLKTIERLRKSAKWYKKLFFHILDLAVFNSLCLYNKYVKKLGFKKFHLNLINEMIESCEPTRKQSGGGKNEDMPLRLSATNHFPEEHNKHRRCFVCAKYKRRKQTKIYCKECNTTLCPYPCFKLYHTTKNY